MGAGYPPPVESLMRRPLSVYGSADPSPYAETFQRSGSYRVLKSQAGPPGGGSSGSRFMEHASADTNLYGAPIHATPRPHAPFEAPSAYLTMEMQFANATNSFGETTGIHSLQSRRLQDLVSANDREKVLRLQRDFEEERRGREPNYLPPIYLAKFQEEHIIQSVGFGQEESSQIRMTRLETLTFQAQDGQQRTLQARLGLAKRDSTYFIALSLILQPLQPSTPQSFHQPSSSPYSRDSYSRDSQYGYQPTPGASPFAQNSGFGDPRGDMSSYRTPGSLGQGPNPGNMNLFGQPLVRSEYPQAPAPYQTPRSELSQTQVSTQEQRPHDLQLPPIRDQPVDLMRRREDRGSNRVDIGGLLERPGPERRGH